ncbi:MAG: hypothetical protein HYS65_07075 [Betaproteobacteria bacterium]|nr:hypothetical protein [Betaproteobacteria bacterium]MBI2227127.1 hypothetical protein [Betaproteobacteria bacterium]MBI2288781.1 hypothetical protein [Betaproteobacteria bacterium]MBI3054334.1 hypothetical protein [Betaproteobacteria bacterium]
MKTEDIIDLIVRGEPGADKRVLEHASDAAARARVIRALIALLDRWPSSEIRHDAFIDAIAALGKLNAEEAIPALLRVLLLQPGAAAAEPIREIVYTPPAVEALIGIGERSVPETLAYLRQSDPENAAIPVAVQRVVAGVLGERAGRELIEREIRISADPAERSRLEECLEYFGIEAGADRQ